MPLIKLLGVLALSILPLSATALNEDLEKIHLGLQKKFTSVDHLNAQQFSQLDLDNTLVFDVREPGEHAISHLQGAVQIDPGIKPELFIEQYGDALKGKTAVFYCSVGHRSSRLIEKLNDYTEERQSTLEAQQVYNLEGGIFNWTNESRSLYRQDQPTDRVHPYSWYRSKLIDKEHRDQIQYRLEKTD